MTNNVVFNKVLECFDSQAQLAGALNVAPQSLAKWRKRIPAERVLELEQLTSGAVTRYEMRSDVYGEFPHFVVFIGRGGDLNHYLNHDQIVGVQNAIQKVLNEELCKHVQVA